MEKNIYFKRRPVSQVIDYRPIWKIGQILLIVRDGSSKSGCSLLKLHLFSWTFQGYKNRNKLRKWISSDFDSTMTIWTLSPHVNRAIAFGIGEKLLKEGRLTTEEFDFDNSVYLLSEDRSDVFDYQQAAAIALGRAHRTLGDRRRVTDHAARGCDLLMPSIIVRVGHGSRCQHSVFRSYAKAAPL